MRRISTSSAPKTESAPLTGEAVAHPDRGRHREPGPMPLLLGLAAPEAVLPVVPGELAAREGGGAGRAQAPGLGLPPGPGLGPLRPRREEEVRLAAAGRRVHPVGPLIHGCLAVPRKWSGGGREGLAHRRFPTAYG